MDNANINNEDEDEFEQLSVVDEEERIAAAEQRRFKTILVLVKKEGFSLRARNIIDELVEKFLQKLGD